MTPLFAQKGLELQVEDDSNYCELNRSENDFKIMNDADRLKQVVINFIKHFFKQKNSGFVKLKYKCFLRNDEISCVRCSVIDSEQKICENTKKNISNLCGLLEELAPSELNTNSLDLSLAINTKLLQLMNPSLSEGAVIQIEHSPGGGSALTFEIISIRDTILESKENILFSENFIESLEKNDPMSYFKYTGVSSLKTEDEMLMPFTIKMKKKMKKQKRILYAEDDPVNILVMKRYLTSNQEYKLECVSNGLEAVRMVQTEFPYIDVILMDCNMPVMDGYEATAEIRKIILDRQLPDIPIIAVTANVLQSDLERCLSCGMNDYITKPFKKEEIIKKIEFNLDLFKNS